MADTIDNKIIKMGMRAIRAAVFELNRLDPGIRSRITHDLGARGKVRLSDKVANTAVSNVLDFFAKKYDISIHIRNEDQEGDSSVLNPAGKKGMVYVDLDELDGTINFNELKGISTINLAFSELLQHKPTSLSYQDFRIGVVGTTAGNTYFGNTEHSYCVLSGRQLDKYQLTTSNLKDIKGA